MSDEDFLSRWSRRKHEAAQSARSAEPVAPEASPPQAAEAPVPEKTEPAKTEDEFDLASLPPIDSITATTDITAFLRKGVPLELSRAALRRAWTSDPTIRDFIGPAENAWDFNDPNAMPGFGPLDQTPEQIRELADRIVGRVRSATEELASASDEGQPQRAATNASAQIAEQPADSQPAAVEKQPDEDRTPCSPSDTPDSAAERSDDVAMQQDKPALTLRRAHGGALPR